MAAKVKLDMSYYDFLNMVQEISNNSSSIQNTFIKITMKNYDISHVKSALDKEIDNLNTLILK
ncbi:MAG: hypothetical protein ACXADU_10055 [Promethearchaeota archaeon]|jgi:hypothetical protein